ncbi:protein tyrosine phosphatase type IVA 3-like [Anoplophora glabripennis]|uniref:protein tyrosine phosphatase type IVA 3-like n=1 Tax=Anoplophora glabripennis TaxID=217634 RepID=UPI000874E325|nr:protein tyrosine phosphatase type IVA 3-like [Anoplophora glabripennis]XP_018570671.1 protein tyrosine phosphatase type IVA 3-like [Anoplophora glabripennis]
MDDFVEISHKGFRFIISKNPVNKSVNSYIKELKKRNVGVVIRACKPSYDTKPLFKAGIQVYDLTIEDGASPSEEMLSIFFNIIKKQFCDSPDDGIAIHCVAGLGRAPVLVAVALIELGYTYEDAVDLIRRKRRGAINAKQLNFLANYKPKSRLKDGKKRSCVIQ